VTGTATIPRPGRATRGPGWVPNQHGAWAMLASPLLVGVVAGGFAWVHLALTALTVAAHEPTPSQPSIDYKDAIYRVGNKDVTLLGGQHTQPAAADSAAQEVTRVIEPPEHAGGTLDGRPAVAVFLSDDGAGSGTFYYAAVVFGDGRGTTFMVGDRIQPIGIAIHGDDLVVSYLDRKPDEPMVVSPTIPRERHFAYMNDQLVERPQALPAAK